MLGPVFSWPIVLCALFLLWSKGLAVSSVDNNVNNARSCYEGAYRVREPPFTACAGFRLCEPGHYCSEGERRPCPAGRFGNASSLSTAICSGVCPAGSHCPEASIAPQACGSAAVYCPEGSAAPVLVPMGYYSLNDANNAESDAESDIARRTRSAVALCPQGMFCANGTRFSCPAGFYGREKGETSSTCSGVCPAGFFCPAKSVDAFAHPCPAQADLFCPEGAQAPIAVGEGFYTVRNSESVRLGGGHTEMRRCPRGTYCVHGKRFPCPAGRFGQREGETNSSCTAACRAGFYCPEGSFTSSQFTCDETASFCPTGSARPLNVSVGHYTVGSLGDGTLAATLIVDDNVVQSFARSAEQLCEPGHYCAADGIKRPCPPGRYGATAGLSSSRCSGYCEKGYYCPEGSVSAREHECGAPNIFCPPGSAVPQHVDVGFYTLGGENNRSHYEQRPCEAGSYCVEGIKRLCIAGYFGDVFGQTIPTCSGPCLAGYYCPEGSISPTEVLCGDPNRFCVANSTKPVDVSIGYYSIGGNESTRTGQRIAPQGYFALDGRLFPCPAGYYGAEEGLSSPDCSGKCNINGFYCPVASTSPWMRYCGDDHVFCPAGTVAPIQVKPGFYTVDYEEDVCPPGQWRNFTIPLSFFTDSDGNYSAVEREIFPPPCSLCPEGTYKLVPGDDFALCLPCDSTNSVSTSDRRTCECTERYLSPFVGFFNIHTGMCEKVSSLDIVSFSQEGWALNTSLTRYFERVCEPGYYCQGGRRYRCPSGHYGSLFQESNPLCRGECTRGFFCLSASTSPQSRPCGAANLICPQGSSEPRLVPAGYYSQEDTHEHFRFEMFVCPPGYYCPGDGKRYLCPQGTYADEEGTISSQCKGLCERGHYCLEGSTNPRQYRCGNATVFCPRGSGTPTHVNDGFYCVHSGPDAGEQAFWDKDNSTCSAELPCEPGYYCTAGVKYPCPPGRFGWRYGMTNNLCGGECAPGYYCPSYMLPMPDAPSWTVWPGKPHTRADEHKCGDVNYICPRGSFYPRRVRGGYYSIGGDRDNKTRNAEVICPRGTYCSNSVPILCPKGRYGSREGLRTSDCTDRCPAGFYCPGGSASPTPCPGGSYSTGNSWSCVPCPGKRTTPMKCKNENSCCNRD